MIDFWVIIFGILNVIWVVIKYGWWVILPVGLFFIFIDFWERGQRSLYIKKMKWVFLEIKIPGNVLKTPKAMDNIFTALHSIVESDPNWKEVFFKGKVLPWYSFELVGYAGGVSFYVRAPESAKHLVENAIYSEYPDAEIITADDYVNFMPAILPNDVYDIAAGDYILAKPNPYPIQTYPYFEANVEEQRLDPVAAITEVMSRLKEGEALWLQYLIRPVGDGWKKEGEEIRDKMYGRKKPEKKPSFLMGIINGFFEFLWHLHRAPLIHPEWSSSKPSEDKGKTVTLSPGERSVLEAIENKIAKYGFQSAIRYVYIDRKDEFTQLNVAALLGAFKQFGTQDKNSFKAGPKPTAKFLFRKSKTYTKRAMYDAYKARAFPAKTSILCTEELATVYHFPITSVGSPMLRRVETRKGEPPSNLPL
jgi:hypothetical protein